MAILPPDPIYIFRGDMGPVHGLAFRTTPYIEHLYAGTETGNIHVWDLKTNRELLRLDENTDSCLGLSVRDERLVAQRKGGAVEIWSADGSGWRSDEIIPTAYCGFCRNEDLDDDVVLVPLPNSSVGALSFKTRKFIYKLDRWNCDGDRPALGEIMAIKRINDAYALGGYESGHIALWDLKQRRVLSSLKLDECSMAINFDNYWMKGVVGSPSDKLEVFETSKSHVLRKKSTLTIKNPGISTIGSRPDGKVFATGGWDGRLRIYSWKTLRPLCALDQHRGTVHDVAYSDGKVDAYGSGGLMAAAAQDGTISLWDLYNR